MNFYIYIYVCFKKQSQFSSQVTVFQPIIYFTSYLLPSCKFSFLCFALLIAVSDKAEIFFYVLLLSFCLFVKIGISVLQS
ncbi:hypothetical protein Ahy_A10g051325 isoform C [Arachis hypogaea]|uniref:Uncharacterized protein n=1 Tax=Arachis hypogaea TaxID=3818 RepID=A0A445BCD1_ARAHY|nr:hypothetical protein Ahy_A10g051325 isoform C [Arachis hypogaea]